MASTHYTTIGLTLQPSCADQNGFIPFDRRQKERIQKLIEAGKPAEFRHVSNGTWLVAKQCAYIADFNRR